MLAGLSELPEGTHCTPPKGGLFHWLELPEGMNADALFQPTRDAGVLYVRGSYCFLEGGERTLRLAYSGVGVEQIAQSMRRPGGAFSSLVVRQGGSVGVRGADRSPNERG